MNSSSYPPGTIAALALSGLILFFLISLLLLYLLFWRPRVRQRRFTERTVKPQHRESGDIVVIQRGKYANVADEADPFSPRPRDAGQDEKPESVLDNASFRFAFVPKGKAKSNSERTTNSRSFYSHAIMDVDLIPPRRDTVPRSPSRATSDIVILPTPPVPPLATPLDDSQPTSTGRSPESVSAGQEGLVLPTTTVRSQPLSQVSPIPADPEIRVAPSSQATPTSPIETTTGAQAAARSPEPRPLPKSSDDEDFEYVDLDVLGGGSGEPSGSSRPHGGVVEGFEDQESSGPARQRSSRRGRDSVEDDSSGSPQFLRVRESSPFRVDFRRGSLKPSRPSTARTRHSGSRVRFQDEPPEESTSSDDSSPTSPTQALAASQASAPEPPPAAAAAPAPTLPTSPTTTAPRRVDRGAITSFLDLTASSGSPAGSLRTHSSSGSSRHSQPPERSRWSTTTTSQSMYTNPSNTNIASPSGTGNEESRRSLTASSRVFPFRVSFNPPHIQRRSSQQPEARESRPPEVQQILIPAAPASPPAAHPFTFTDAATLPSPTHSVPTTISDLHFRHSLSDDASRIESQRASTGSHLPPHPPLPSGFEFRRHHRDRSSLSQLSSSLANQPSIVQRVLGLQSPGPETPSPTLGRNTSAMSGTPSTKSPSLARIFRP